MFFKSSNLDLQIAQERFSEEFNAEWKRVLESVDCSQAQLLSGHRLRPLISFWGYVASLPSQQFCQDDYSLIAHTAVSIELLHKASLLFDDWLDSDNARHGSPTFHIEYSPQLAVVFGLHLVGIATKRIKDVLQLYKQNETQYTSCIEVILDTIYNMSLGALSELRLTGTELFDLNRVREIAKLETSEIIGNSIQLGYIIGSSPSEKVSAILKHIGIQCGGLFQTMNDLEAFGSIQGNVSHKGKVNFDIDHNRKNIAIATLYQLADKEDKAKIVSSTGTEIAIIAARYNLLEFITQDMENVYRKMMADIQALVNYNVTEEWIGGFSEFIRYVHDISIRRLSTPDDTIVSFRKTAEL